MNTQYSRAIIFTKYTDLLQWFNSNQNKLGLCSASPSDERYQRIKKHYALPRVVRLILLMRSNDEGHLVCKIKCPINPLPVKGEFEAVSINCVTDFLQKEGWEIKERIPLYMMK